MPRIAFDDFWGRPPEVRHRPGKVEMIFRSHAPLSPAVARAARRRASSRIAAALCLLLGATLLDARVHAEDTTSAPPAGERPRVPKVSVEGPAQRVEGKIIRSSRGKKGPVRLLVERKDGEPVTVLVAPEDVCDRLRLSLKTEENVVVEGSMLKSDRPILIANSFVVDGKTIRVRDAEGKVLDPAAALTPATGAATGNAVTGGGKPASSPAP
jgi:hypothetical protein